MVDMTAWAVIAGKCASEPPFRFVHGMRHTVGSGICCQVHSHREAEIVFHTTGRGVSRAEGEPVRPFRAGDVVVYAPGQPHDQVMDEPGDDFCVQIALPSLGRRKLRHGFHVAAIEEPLLLDELRALSQDRVSVSREEQVVLNLRATSALCALIHLASARVPLHTASGPERHVTAAEQYIRENFAGIRSLRDVAARGDIGYDHLRHLFKQHRSRSLVQHLNEVRMERATTLLAHSRLPLKQIATMCGFRDEYYFSAVFRRHVRMPPGRYRARLG